jgi:hypothetical protein
MISNIVLAVVIGIITTLVCIFVGGLLATIGISWAAATGAFLVAYGALIGLLAALWFYFTRTRV